MRTLGNCPDTGINLDDERLDNAIDRMEDAARHPAGWRGRSDRPRQARSVKREPTPEERTAFGFALDWLQTLRDHGFPGASLAYVRSESGREMGRRDEGPFANYPAAGLDSHTVL